MIRHLLKMVWNRKRKNVLIIVEILCSFTALFGITLTILNFLDNSRRPLGFNWHDTWCITIQFDSARIDQPASLLESIEQAMLTIKSLPEVKAVAGGYSGPYTDSMASMIGGTAGNFVTDSYREVFQIPLVSGRWFSREDDANSWLPVVINERFARERFPDGSPLGKRISPPEDKTELRVVGVMPDFRRQGEYSSPENFTFFRLSMQKGDGEVPGCLLLRAEPGTGAGFEEKLATRLQSVVRDLSFNIQPMETVRGEFLKNYLLPLIIAGLVVTFLLIMVGLGLTGVQWQNITQRTKELGLRRASGASAGKIAFQIMGEVVIVTTLGIIIGVVLVVQLPLLDLLGFFDPLVYTGSIVLAALLIYLMNLAAALYPGYLASRIQPADALRYE